MNKEELKLLNEMKDNCLNGAKYIDPKSMEKYNLLRKLEDRINELQQENKELYNKINELKSRISSKIQKYQQKIDNEIDMGSQGDYLKILNYKEKICLLEDVLKDVVKLKDSDVDE